MDRRQRQGAACDPEGVLKVARPLRPCAFYRKTGQCCTVPALRSKRMVAIIFHAPVSCFRLTKSVSSILHGLLFESGAMEILCLKKRTGVYGLLIPLVLLFLAARAIAIEIPLQKHGGVYTLQVQINGVYTAPFILDSGATEVTIPADVVLALLRAGTISEDDFLPGKKYRLGDGSIVKGSRFNLRELEVGGFRVSNVPAVVVPVTGSLLLGQSFLSRAVHWEIDNERQVLVLFDSKTPTHTQELYDFTKLPDKYPVGAFGLKWGDSSAQAKAVMLKLDAVDNDDVCQGDDKSISKEVRGNWEYFANQFNFKQDCEERKKFNKETEKFGESDIDFHGTFMHRDASISLTFTKFYGLYSVFIGFDKSPEGLYPDLLSVLKARYGPPGRTATRADANGERVIRSAYWWPGAVTRIELSEEKSKTPFGLWRITTIDYTDWKTSQIANKRHKKYILDHKK